MKILVKNSKVISHFSDSETLTWVKLENEKFNVTTQENADSLAVGGSISNGIVTGYSYRIGSKNITDLYENVTVPAGVDFTQNQYNFDGTDFIVVG